MDLHSQGLDVVSSIGTTSEVTQIELNLIPSLIQSHRHRTNERLHSSFALVVRGTESAAHILVVQYLHLECEVFLQLN